MKNVIVLLLLITGLTQGLAQTAKTRTSGDDELDKSIMYITKMARKDAATFKASLISKYNITEAQTNDYYAKYPGGDLYMILETAKQTGKPVETVFEVYNKNRATKGWNDTLKDLGIKQSSKVFESLKEAVVNNGID